MLPNPRTELHGRRARTGQLHGSEQMNIRARFCRGIAEVHLAGRHCCRSGPHVRCQCHHTTGGHLGHRGTARRYRKSSGRCSFGLCQRGAPSATHGNHHGCAPDREPCVLLAGSGLIEVEPRQCIPADARRNRVHNSLERCDGNHLA